MDWINLAQDGPVAGSCEHGFHKRREIP